jgi:uncharacterized DUF497 family protein
MKFGWNPDKSETNRRERGFGFDYAALIFLGDTLECPDRRFDYGEERIRALGMVDGRCLAVTFTMRDNVHWIISAHPASRIDRDVYQQTFPDDIG